jgi:predicted nucleic acid-binding protein
VILVDAGPLIAAFDSSDGHHLECARLLQDAPEELLVPQPVIAEVCYMIGRARFGASVEALFLRSFADGSLSTVALEPSYFQRMAELVEQYASLPLGGSDASVIALAERLRIDKVATLDRRHFTVVRPRHQASLILLP